MHAATTTSGFNGTFPLACLLVGVTAVLLCFGALVTTYDAAMAVPDWPATYGHNMFLFPFAEWFYGPWDLFLEHGHRLLGATVGLITLALAGLVWLREPNSTIRGLVVAAVLLVIVQGALGGARVLLDDRTVAKVHACTGPLFFAVAVAIATLTARSGRSDLAGLTAPPSATRVGILPASAAGLLVASYVQLVAGAQLRHLDASIDPRTFRWLVAVHLVGAAAVLLLSLLVAAAAWSRRVVAGIPRFLSAFVLVLVALQMLLGVGAWIANWGVPAALQGSWSASLVPDGPIVARSLHGSAMVTAHVVTGMAILGAAVVLAIRSGGRPFAARHGGSPEPRLGACA